MTAQEIISKFGGLRPMAKALGTHHSKVQYWNDQNRIPHKNHCAILVAARKKRLGITADDLAKANGSM